MFDKSYDYRFINKQLFTRNEIKLLSHNYSFRGKRKRYIVIAEQFDFDVYAVKFYLQEHKNCEHRFRWKTNEYECTRILCTLGKIIAEIYNNNPFASFAFLGSPSMGEGYSDTKRFQLYCKVIANCIGPVHFEHQYSKEHSAYLLLNRDLEEADVLDKIVKMFSPFLDHSPN